MLTASTLFVSLALAAPLPATQSGATAPSDAAQGAGDVLIVSPRDELPLTTSAAQVIVVTGEELARTGERSLPRAIGRAAGVFMLESNLGGGSPVIRGFASGIMTMRALDAAERLASDGVGVAVLHVPTIKPLDVPTILEEVGRGGRLVVTAENHTENGGLGEAVAKELLLAGLAPKFRMIALPDQFLEAGALPTLHDMYGMSVAKVAERIRAWL